MKRWIGITLATLLLVMSVLVSLPTPALAVVNPDTPPQVSAVYVYALEDGGVGVLVDHYLNYAVNPDENATEAYMVAFVDTDGTTILKSVAPYTFQNSGYERNLAWVAFTADEVATYSIDSADIADYRIWLMGNPTLHWTDATATVAMTGAVADDGGVQTGETAEANSAAANDMTLLPAVPVVNDAYYFGGVVPFDLLTINIGTQGDGTWAITWEYWDGSDWSTLPDISDGTTAFEAAVGNRDVSWTIPTNWNTATVDGIAGYWVRARVSSYTAVVAQPLGTQAWINPADPPKTVATVDEWSTVGDPATLIALRVLYYADVLELAWSLDMIEITSIGNRLTTIGESYFENVIANLRAIAPACFASGESYPDAPTITYDTTYGATATSGTATLTVSPDTLTEGTDTVDTGVTVGTFTITLARWTFGTIDDDTGTIAGTPLDLTPGVNTFTVTGAGTFTIETEVVNTITLMEDTVTGTAFDLTDLAALFGLSRWFLSGVIWIGIVIIMCGALYRSESRGYGGISSGGSKAVMILFAVGVIGGALLGLVHPLVAAMLFIGCGAFIGYVFFFRSETLHKGFMFMVWMFVIVSLAGNYVAGTQAIVATRLTADLTEIAVDTLSVASTEGFPSSGYIVIGDERIGYPSKTATSFDETTVGAFTIAPVTRGEDGTDAAAHSEDDMVRTPEAAGLNASLDYKISRIVDSAGFIDFLSLPPRILDLVLTFFVLPLDFLGTDLVLLAYVWGVVAGGMIIGFIMAVLGARRV